MVKRKKGEDKITDDAYEAELQALIKSQEEYKKAQGVDESQVQNPEFKDGGKLPQYEGRGTSQIAGGYNYPNEMMDSKYGRGYDNMNNYMNPIQNQMNTISSGDIRMQDGIRGYLNPTSPGSTPNPTELTILESKTIPTSESGSIGTYNPTASLLGPALSIGSSIASSAILKNNAEKRKTELLKNIGTSKIKSQEIDLGRARTAIDSNQALSEATGRQLSKGVKSASERAAIQNLARLRSQRIGGDQKNKSFEAENLANSQIRRGDTNANLALDRQRQAQRMGIEGKYGDAPAQIDADLARTTGQTIQNYSAENQRMRDFYAQANMLNPNFEIDFQENYEKLTPRQQRLRRMGIGTVGYQKKVT